MDFQNVMQKGISSDKQNNLNPLDDLVNDIPLGGTKNKKTYDIVRNKLE